MNDKFATHIDNFPTIVTNVFIIIPKNYFKILICADKFANIIIIPNFMTIITTVVDKFPTLVDIVTNS